MKRYYAGLDLGTSSVKLLLIDEDGRIQKIRQTYDEISPEGWFAAIRKAAGELWKTVDPAQLAALGLSSQVGTYVTDTGTVIGWNEPVGKAELEELKQTISQETFVKEIAMAHPDLVSYPLPRLLHIKRTDPACREVLMPKELLLRALTGRAVTDRFSQRGIAHTITGKYTTLIKQLELPFALPQVFSPTDLAGRVTPDGSEKLGFPAGLPVYVGCNDFFAGLLGMGVLDVGSLFDLTGTSEHIGLISNDRLDGKLVSGPYFEHCVTYGGTKASGTSAAFAGEMFGLDGMEMEVLENHPPIFLPYLTGERAPIYDETAKGVFFGIGAETGKREMAYSVLEGIVFSLYHIAEAFPSAGYGRMIVGGGAAVNRMMAYLKAEMFGCAVDAAVEPDSSALGAAILAMVGSGRYASLREAVAHTVMQVPLARPDGRYRNLLLQRYAVYRRLYGHLKEDFIEFATLNMGKGGEMGL